MSVPASSTAQRLPSPLIAAAPVGIAVLLTILMWPIPNRSARVTLDESWQIALHLAAQLGLRHGVDIVFTYGPLGFLGYPNPYVGATSGIALVATFAVYLALTGTLLFEARRILPLWAAVVVTLLVARIANLLPPFEAFQAVVFIWCVEILADRVRWPTPAVAATAGILAGAAFLGKANIGVVVFLMGAVALASVGRPRWQGLAIYVAVTVASATALWLVLRQQLTDIGAYLSGIYQIIAGYNDAMGRDPDAGRTWIFLVFAGVAGILIWFGWRNARDWPRRRQLGLALLAVVLGFAMWKTMVVRERAPFVFATVLVGLFAFAPRVEPRTWLTGVLAVAIAVAGSEGIEARTFVDAVGSVGSLSGEARYAFLRPDLGAQRTTTALRRWYQLDPTILAAIGDRTVEFDPYMTSAAFAYPELKWSPLPIFQSYSAYTPELDRRNADRLRSDVAPERILRNFLPALPNDMLRQWIGRPLRPGEVFPATVDGRFRWFEAPSTTLETFCRYAEVVATDRWQVLARTGRSCGVPESIGTVTAKAGETVTVPVEGRANRFVIARIRGLEPSPLGRLRAALYKARDWYVQLDDTRYRLVPATAQDGLLLAVPAAADGTGRFAFGAPIRTIAITQGQTGRESAAPLTYEFLSVPFAPP